MPPNEYTFVMMLTKATTARAVSVHTPSLCATVAASMFAKEADADCDGYIHYAETLP